MAAAALRPAAIQLVPASSLHVSRPVWWLESRFHFSFADYFDRERMNFGALRVVNDDLVKGGAGFGTHPHRDAEIFSYVLDGRLTHADSMGNRESLGRGGVQYMSAGSGVTHSEENDHEETCRFIQVWLTPAARGLEPQYGSSTHERGARHNRLLQILAGTGPPPDWPGLAAAGTRPPPRLHADTNVVVSESDGGVAHALTLGPARQAYLLCMEGALTANGQRLGARDAARVSGDGAAPAALEVAALGERAHFLVVEMAQPPGG
ncbi:HAD subfamily IA [Raphidocelis subcapitata]|uniref:HAD subfamily IA n=1 Tax=Raphidocelis subcapitata TaxID=307507 RepID=A0A2V0NL51_9CHLO|nr:HAD subfamily IA [Raphidocelis subcapitata]|eukprot:GBF87789.1 HAD subfamily IA [Raphidocelis subcapitata]